MKTIDEGKDFWIVNQNIWIMIAENYRKDGTARSVDTKINSQVSNGDGEEGLK